MTNGTASACNCTLRESGTISARSLEMAFLQPSLPGLHHTLAGILAQEIYSGESLLFLRKAAQLRQRAQPLFARYAPPLGPQSAESSDSGRRLDEARLRLYQMLEGVQGPEGPTPHASRDHRRHPSLSKDSPPPRPGATHSYRVRASLRVPRGVVAVGALVHPLQERDHLDGGDCRLEALIAGLGTGPFDGLLDSVGGDDPEDYRQVRL